MFTSSKTSISKERHVRQKVANPIVSNSGNAAKCPKNSGNSADVRKTTLRRKSDIPVAVNSRNASKCSNKASSSVEERQNFSLLCSKTPIQSQAKRTVQPGKKFDQKIDDKSKNTKCSAKNKSINFFNSKESCQAKENETRSHLSQKESGATRKAPLIRDNLSKNNSCSVSKPIPVSKEGKLEKSVEARRTVYPKKIEPNKSIFKRPISKSDLNLNISGLSGEKNANKNIRKVPDSVFESGMKKVSFKYPSANDLNSRQSENAVKTIPEEISIFGKLKMPFNEKFCHELEGNCIDDLFTERCIFEDSFSDGSSSNEQFTVSEKYEQLFPSKYNENSTSSLTNPEKISTYNNRNKIYFDPTVDEKASILTDPRKTKIPFYFEDAMQFTKNRITVLSPRYKKENYSQLNAFSENTNDNNQGSSFLDSFGSLINMDAHNGSEISEGSLKCFEKATDVYSDDCIADQSQSIDEYASGKKEISADYMSKQQKKNQDSVSEQAGNDKIFYKTQGLVKEEEDKGSQLTVGFSCNPAKSNNESSNSTEFIFPDPISGVNSSPENPEKTSLKELSKRDLIEKSIEEKIRILTKQFLKQIKSQNKNYYMFLKEIEHPEESGNGLVNSSDPVHCDENKKQNSLLTNLLLDYYDQHIKSPSALSKTSHIQQETLISGFTVTPRENFKLSEQVEGAKEGFQNFTLNREECEDTAPNGRTAEEYLKSMDCCEESDSENFKDIFNELDSVRKFDEFFEKAVMDEDTVREILQTYFLAGENNCLNQLKLSEEEETIIRNNQISSHRKTNIMQREIVASLMFKQIPIATIVFFLFTCIVRYFQMDN